MGEEGEVADVVPMVVGPNDRGDGIEVDAFRCEDFADVLLDFEAGDHVAESLQDAGGQVPEVFAGTKVEHDLLT